MFSSDLELSDTSGGAVGAACVSEAECAEVSFSGLPYDVLPAPDVAEAVAFNADVVKWSDKGTVDVLTAVVGAGVDEDCVVAGTAVAPEAAALKAVLGADVVEDVSSVLDVFEGFDGFMAVFSAVFNNELAGAEVEILDVDADGSGTLAKEPMPGAPVSGLTALASWVSGFEGLVLMLVCSRLRINYQIYLNAGEYQGRQ